MAQQRFLGDFVVMYWSLRVEGNVCGGSTIYSVLVNIAAI